VLAILYKAYWIAPIVNDTDILHISIIVLNANFGKYLCMHC